MDGQYHTNNTEESSLKNDFANFHTFVNICNKYFIPIILITGITGNIISFVVFICSQLKRLSTSVYLAALALADTGFLICVGLGWLDNVGVNVFRGNGSCQIIVWVTYVFSFLSVWYVVCFTTEMYLTIFHSHIGHKISKPKKARIVVCFVTSFACALYAYTFWSAKSQTVDGKLLCVPHTENRNVVIGLTLTDTTITLVLPLSILIFMNTRILILIMQVYNTKTDCDSNSSSVEGTIDGGQANDCHRVNYASKVQRKTTKMLVTVAMSFLFLNLPSHAIRVQSLLRTLFQPGYATTEIEYLCQQVVQLLYYLNFAINFVIYNACAKSFRRAILRLPEIIMCCTCAEEDAHHRNRRQRNPRVIRRLDREKIQNSHLVEVHLSEMHLSQMQSFDPGFICRSPPCLIQEGAPLNHGTTSL
ncbi:thyrotropin-releasing hormone receptor-like [Haliotis asinina]|uniref:thyrotropin-releasing hormone receptor-like n=1 Tax=Haliotis asinina TaxID=109174 RepID=UPI0035318EE7